MKSFYPFAKHVGLLLLLSAVLSFFVWGCSIKDSEENLTQVKIEVTKKDGNVDAKIDPTLHPDVAVLIEVTATDFGSPMRFFFSPEKVRAEGGLVTMMAPNGKDRTFTPYVFEFYRTVTADVFPGTNYIPITPVGARTVDLIGDPVVLDIDMTYGPVVTMQGIIRDDRTGAMMPIDVACANPNVTFTFGINLFKGTTIPVPITIGGGGNYIVQGMPVELGRRISAADSTTGAASVIDLNIPSATTTVTQNFDLTGAEPLTLAPDSVSVAAGGTANFTITGGIAPYSLSISPAITGDLMNPATGIAENEPVVFTAAPVGGGRVLVVTVVDSCGASVLGTITVN